MTPNAAAASFHAMGSPARLAVLRALIRAGDAGLSVGEVQARTGMAASTLSHHLRVLTEAGVIEQRREGRATLTRAAYGHLRDLAAYILCECCADAVQEAHDADHLELVK